MPVDCRFVASPSTSPRSRDAPSGPTSTRHPSPEGRISIVATRENAHVSIAVADTGSGIGAEHLPYVFDRFYRADPSRDRATGGAGLGLAIVRRLAEAHGGSVTAASEGEGRGATFTVRLPLG